VPVRPADHAGVGDPRVAAQGPLHLVGVDVGAAPDDQVLGAPGHDQVAVLVKVAEVTHVDPAVSGVGAEGFAPVALLDGVPAHADLALGRDQDLTAVVRAADGVMALGSRVGGAAHAQLPGVHRAVEDADSRTGPVLPIRSQVGWHGGAGDGGDPGSA